MCVCVCKSSVLGPLQGELPGKEQEEVPAEERRELPVEKQEGFSPILSYPVFTRLLSPREWHLNPEDRGPVGSVHVIVIGKHDVIPDDCYPICEFTFVHFHTVSVCDCLHCSMVD